MKNFQIFSAVFLSSLFPSLAYGDLFWNCRSELTGTSAYQRYINVDYTFWSGKFKSVVITLDGTREIASAGPWTLSTLNDGRRQITQESWPGGALDVRIYTMSESIFDPNATQGTLVEKATTNSATTEVLYQCVLN